MHRRPEPECVPPLVEEATLPPELAAKAESTARRLVLAIRAKPRKGGVEELIHEYSLSGREGVALMCLAEALLRIPDDDTRDALIRDKVAAGDWRSHLGPGRSLFVNAATWGLMVTGRLTAETTDRGLSAALTRLIARGGEPVIRAAVDMAMRMMGEQFVTGRTIEEALANSREREARGFRYSYDMLGEAAVTAEDAARYFAAYENAIEAIGRSATGTSVRERAGISIKLSALHPRYSRAQAGRVKAELLPRLRALALCARRHDIGFNIDAEEADRLDLSLDLLEAICFEPGLAGWHGIGFVVQAYGKRCPAVIDFLVDLARRSGHRLMIRLVKGAYWDSEIKRAQVDGLDGFPVYTRKIHTDVAYIACARRLLAAEDAVFPQFATHNAQTLATIHALAGDAFTPDRHEFQCLHGMGEPLYDEVVDPAGLNRPCRIYAPVGTHETLLPYLVRRLLENGANSSFVNRISDSDIAVDDLVADPVDLARAIQPLGAPHPLIRLPRDLHGEGRRNSEGIDLSNERCLAELAQELAASAAATWTAGSDGPGRVVVNPADGRDIVGRVFEPGPDMAAEAMDRAKAAAAGWAATAPSARAAALRRAADLLQAALPRLAGLIVREGGRTVANAIGEVREAVDFLRYYAGQAETLLEGKAHRPLGPVVCISPWNFPLAIFTGQVAAALAAGNTVLAKPAEETPLTGAASVRLLHEAGIPGDVLQLVPGDGRIGAALVAHPATRGVVFTGSTEVARLIQRQLAEHPPEDGRPVPLIAETAGQNAMIVDSSALAEQAVGDALVSAFDSAGQRCSALRILCLQDDVAERLLEMLKGAMRELSVGDSGRLSTDVGPVIGADARRTIEKHVETMRARGFRVHTLSLPDDTRHGTFVSPTVVEIDKVADVEREVFGPVLHVLRYRRQDLDRLIDDINGTGYGLTFGLHTRIDRTVDRVAKRIAAGNVYVNRNIVGAVVGVQPFGGLRQSGTGPKAGGPLYLLRLLSAGPGSDIPASRGAMASVQAYCAWLDATGRAEIATRCRRHAEQSALGVTLDLPGPVGEQNRYRLHGRGRVALLPSTETGLLLQLGAALATGNDVVVVDAGVLAGLPPELAKRVMVRADWEGVDDLAGVLLEGEGERAREVAMRLAHRPGAIVPLQAIASGSLTEGREDYRLEELLGETSTSVNTAAAGGNASLMAIV
jgi:RHH-type proline utilization regulon transcriptional repressor/proline dehydrogenase/delta 1-pyrroline-5-carboxylate dehydrogenase